MAYNLATLRERVRNRLDDEDFEQEYLDRAINYAQWDITNNGKFKFLETTTTLTVNQGDYAVTLPTNFHEYQYLRVLGTNPYNITQKYLDYEDFIDTYIDPASAQKSPPYYWSEYAQALQLATPADKTYSLRLDYQRKATELTDDAHVPDIPEEFAELLELGAYMRIAKREDDYDVKSAEMADYTKLLLDLKSVYGRKKGPGGLRKMRVA